MSKRDVILSIVTEELTARTLEKIVFSRPYDKKIKKATVKLFKKREDVYCQIERFTSDNKSIHENIALADASQKLLAMATEEFVQTDIFSKNGFCEILASKNGHIHIADKRKKSEAVKVFEVASHNREKQYLLDAKLHAPFLSLLGVCDEKGRIFEKKRSKFRQINRFLELLDDVYDSLAREGTLTVCDLCCGKSYLTFAVYYYLTELKKRDVKMYGIDLKEDVISYCKDVAKTLGCENLEFKCQDITTFSLEGKVDLVVSLHACDIATDIVLDFAIRERAKVILSTPCCHHEMMRQLDAPSLSFMTQHSMLKQKLCDAATDGLRGLKLEAFGYRVDMPELIDAEETPKNLMIRAVYSEKRSPANEQIAKKRYLAACEFLGAKPHLGLVE